MDNNSFSNDNTQFVLSFELLYLLRWLVEHDAEKLKKLVSKALAAGLKEEISEARELKKNNATNEEHLIEDIQHSIIEFFGILETLLVETLNEQEDQRIIQRNLMPEIDQIDTTFCDDTIVRTSIEKATAKLEHNSKQNPKELLLKELLRLWKPANKNSMN